MADIDPPYRLDPLQNPFNVKWGGWTLFIRFSWFDLNVAHNVTAIGPYPTGPWSEITTVHVNITPTFSRSVETVSNVFERVLQVADSSGETFHPQFGDLYSYSRSFTFNLGSIPPRSENEPLKITFTITEQTDNVAAYQFVGTTVTSLTDRITQPSGPWVAITQVVLNPPATTVPNPNLYANSISGLTGGGIFIEAGTDLHWFNANASNPAIPFPGPGAGYSMTSTIPGGKLILNLETFAATVASNEDALIGIVWPSVPVFRTVVGVGAPQVDLPPYPIGIYMLSRDPLHPDATSSPPKNTYKFGVRPSTASIYTPP